MTDETPEEIFGFEKGDHVLVRHRENGDSGRILAKFEGTVAGFSDSVSLTSPKVLVTLPWGENVRLRPYQAEFEVIE